MSDRKRNLENRDEAPRWTTVGSDSDSSESSESEGSTHNKKSKKESKDKKSKKHKSEKKHKHHKHTHDHEKKDKRQSNSVNQNNYGKFGIIREDMYYQKQKEFEAYVIDVKKKPEILNQSKRDVMLAFSDYVEDYNTATLPHEKYYSYDSWEVKEYTRKKLIDKNNQSISNQYLLDDDSNVDFNSFNDEAMKKKEAKLKMEYEKKLEFEAVKNRLLSSQTVRDDMRRQEQLYGELSVAYKSNDADMIQKLGNQLKPDDALTKAKNLNALLGPKNSWA